MASCGNTVLAAVGAIYADDAPTTIVPRLCLWLIFWYILPWGRGGARQQYGTAIDERVKKDRADRVARFQFD